MSLSAHANTKIEAKLPPIVSSEMKTLMNASGGGVSQTSVSAALDHHLKTLLGFGPGTEMSSLLNAVGKGVAKSASSSLLNATRYAFGHEVAGEMETALLNIS